MSTAIKVENLSKAYQLGEIGTGTISRDLERWWAKTRGKEDPFLRIGETNDRTSKGKSDVVWSLKDINFEIEQGDAVGIIGCNGAGKSTLLKILSRVTSPTTGKITGKGRIASLLEVGTGFHPELTGRENIYLNGAILGMRKKEITHKFDEIVDFAGVERYIDTPVKRYSSGMYVRLAFAVAAHLESEILIVDEVLSVGDAEFQKKCLGKMGEVSKGEGRTVLFVSHNMGAVKELCSKGIVLTNGNVSYYGSSNNAVDSYLNLNTNYNTDIKNSFSGPLSNLLCFNNIIIINDTNENKDFSPLDTIRFIVKYQCLKEIQRFRATLSISKEGLRLCTVQDLKAPERLELGMYQSEFEIPGGLLRSGSYNVSVGGHDGNHLTTGTMWLFASEITSFTIIEEYSMKNDFANTGIFNIPYNNKRIKLN